MARILISLIFLFSCNVATPGPIYRGLLISSTGAFVPFNNNYSSPGTYSPTVPTGSSSLYAASVGAGGSGRRGGSTSFGGSGGADANITIVITPADWGKTITVVVGLGPPGSSSTSSGTAGGNSSITAGTLTNGFTLTCTGGGGGGSGSAGPVGVASAIGGGSPFLSNGFAGYALHGGDSGNHLAAGGAAGLIGGTPGAGGGGASSGSSGSGANGYGSLQWH